MYTTKALEQDTIDALEKLFEDGPNRTHPEWQDTIEELLDSLLSMSDEKIREILYSAGHPDFLNQPVDANLLEAGGFSPMDAVKTAMRTWLRDEVLDPALECLIDAREEGEDQ